jgi:hypothetical protein
MFPLIMVIVCLLLFGIAGMQYLMLLEQRETQLKIWRLHSALAAFEGRREVFEMGAPFLRYEPRTDVADMIVHSLNKRYGIAA